MRGRERTANERGGRREKIRLGTGGEKRGKVASEEERNGGSKQRCDYFGKRCREFSIGVSEWKRWRNKLRTRAVGAWIRFHLMAHVSENILE